VTRSRKSAFDNLIPIKDVQAVLVDIVNFLFLDTKGNGLAQRQRMAIGGVRKARGW
jgi:hypothetical protein